MKSTANVFFVFMVTLACVACAPGKNDDEVLAAPMFMLYNFSGATIMAATAEDSSGGQGNLETPIPDRFVLGLGPGKLPTNDPFLIAVRWIAGPGRVRWKEARLPVKIEQRKGTRIEIYLRPDQWVCASLVDDAHTSHSDQAESARLTQDRSALSCVEPRILPDPMPKSLSGFGIDDVTHSWSRYDHPGTASVTYQHLRHVTGQVEFRYGEAFRGGPWFLSDFYWVRRLGDNASLLVKAVLRPATPGFYLVIGDERGWTSRFLGETGDEEESVGKDLVLIGQRLLVDVATGALYLLPHDAGVDSFFIGLSPDRQYMALYTRTSELSVREGVAPSSSIDLMRLNDGMTTVVAKQSGFPADYQTWFKTHCRWPTGANIGSVTATCF